ncbi:glypican-4 [Brachionus plicatilis]|uniref:Glypican-4 n=1 Tax=Brachionus plicatilis TaxID=10195 RepID=A0A3M7R1N0_BRAPC|nr:glypican-4 [Brachionus plicatilis]
MEPKLVDSANKKFFKSQFFATLQPIRNSFVDLKSYFSEYQINLSEILSKLFLNLFTTNLNSTIPQHNISYSCLVKNFHLIKPFGADIISEMESQIKLSLESAKFFSTGLTRARDILLEIMNKLENPSKECQKMITTMTSCSLCTSDEFYHEKINIKPCYQTCIQAYKTCFSIDLTKFDNIWILMNKLSFHIEFTVNFSNTVNEIKYQLIDGMAYFNTNRHIIVSELLEACQNYTNRDIFLDSNSSKFSYNKRYISSNGLDMHKYFFKAMNFLKEIDGMWKFLISDVCKAITPKSNKDNCWSGTSFKNLLNNAKIFFDISLISIEPVFYLSC